jgi:archaellum biogenesis protein FlaJ (TadC family)
MAAFMKRRKKKQSSFTTFHGIILSLAIAALVGTIFVLIALFWRPPE